jgi:hypothetical protein
MIHAIRTPVVVRWDEGAPGESLPAYRAFTRDGDDFVGGGGTDLSRTLLELGIFGDYEVVDVESFHTHEDRAMWTERLATKTIGSWLADPHRPQGAVQYAAEDLLQTLRAAGITVTLDREGS